MTLVFPLFLKIFFYIVIGYLIALFSRQRLEKIIKYFIQFALYFLFPAFILTTMWQNNFRLLATQKIIIIVLATVIAGHFWALIFARLFKKKFRQISLPLIYMNTAYLAIPINTYLFGSLGTAASIVYSINITLLIFSIGLYLIGDSDNSVSRWREILQLPILYAAFLGIFLNWQQISIPKFILPFSNILQKVTLSVMLIFVGYQLKSAYEDLFLTALWGTLFRMFGGLIVSFLFVKILGLTGPVAGVCLVTSSMPSAINTYILSKRFGGDAHLAAGMIFWGILLCPLVVMLIINYIYPIVR